MADQALPFRRYLAANAIVLAPSYVALAALCWLGDLALGPALDEDLAQRALVDCLHLHGGLVGLDLGEHVALVNRVPFVLAPLAEHAFLHRVGQAGHEYLGHGAS